jgi:hypothetical protein
MDERLKFIARLLDGEKIGAVPSIRHLAQDRLQDPHALQRQWPGRADRPLAPALSACQPAALPDRDGIVRLKQDKPGWRPPKIREKLARLYRDADAFSPEYQTYVFNDPDGHWPSLFPQEASCNLRVNLTRTDAAGPIVMLFSDSRVGMIEQGGGKVRRAPTIGRRG